MVPHRTAGVDRANTRAFREADGPTERPELAWETALDAGEDPTEAGIDVTPALVDGRVYVGGTDGVVYAVDAVTGACEWTRALTHERIVATPTVRGDTVYVGCQDPHARELEHLYALERRTGRVRWAAGTGQGVSSAPRVLDGRVFVVDAGGSSVVAFDAGTGDRLWSASVGREARRPAVADGLLSVATADQVVTLDVASGERQWVAHLENRATTAASVRDDRVILGTWGGTVHAFDAESGDRVWEQEVWDPSLVSLPDRVGPLVPSKATHGPVVTADSVYVATRDVLVGLAAASGERRWTSHLDCGNPSAPVLAGESLFLNTRAGLYCVDTASGDPRWHRDCPDGCEQPPAVGGGRLLLGSGDGYLRAFA